MATNSPANIPTGASGTVLQGQGVGTNSAFSTATYPSTAGTSGNVLTSNGTNWTSSAPPSGSNDSTNAGLYFADDFLYSASSTTNGTYYGPWFLSFNTESNLEFNPDSGGQSNAHPGFVYFSTETSSGYAFISMQNSTIPIVPGGGAITLTFYFNIAELSTGTNTYTLYMGLCDSNVAAPSTNAVYLSYTNGTNSGDWVYSTISGGTSTTSNSTTAVATGWQVAQIVINAAASSVSFYTGTTLAGLTSLGTAITTNIPTSTSNKYGPTFGHLRSAGSGTVTMNLDLVTIACPLTTAR